MSIITSTVLYGGIEFLFDAIGWGLFGYLLFRCFGVKEKYWYLDWIVVSSLFIIYEFWGNSYMIKLNISIGNKEFLRFVCSDVNSLFEMHFVDVLVNAIQILIGYMVGKLALKRLLSVRKNRLD